MYKGQRGEGDATVGANVPEDEVYGTAAIKMPFVTWWLLALPC